MSKRTLRIAAIVGAIALVITAIAIAISTKKSSECVKAIEQEKFVYDSTVRGVFPTSTLIRVAGDRKRICGN